MIEKPRIVVTYHAEWRARQRFGWKPAQVRERVREAILAGRVSAVRPSWCHPPGRIQLSIFAWTEDEQATFAIGGGSKGWHVYTVLGRADA